MKEQGWQLLEFSEAEGIQGPMTHPTHLYPRPVTVATSDSYQ